MMCQPAQLLDTLCSQVTAKSDGVALGLSVLIVQTVLVGVLGVLGRIGNKEHMVPIRKDCTHLIRLHVLGVTGGQAFAWGDDSLLHRPFIIPSCMIPKVDNQASTFGLSIWTSLALFPAWPHMHRHNHGNYHVL